MLKPEPRGFVGAVDVGLLKGLAVLAICGEERAEAIRSLREELFRLLLGRWAFREEVDDERCVLVTPMREARVGVRLEGRSFLEVASRFCC